MSTPEISVVIPTFNRRELVRACLESLHEQTLSRDRFEVIVVSDGCRDGTMEMLREYRAPFELRSIARENGGLSAARNTGNAAARGDILLCLDCDMIASPELIGAHLAAHERAAAGSWKPRLVQGRLGIHDSVRRTPFLCYDERLLERTFRDLEERRGHLNGEDIFGGNISLPRALLDSVGGFNEELRRMRNTDGELALRLEAVGTEVDYSRDALAYQTHVKDLEEALRAQVLYGKAYVFGCGPYPETRWKHSPLVRDRGSTLRNLVRHGLVLRQGERWRLGWLERLGSVATKAAEAVRAAPLARALYRVRLDLAFWRGVHEEAGGRLEPFRPRGVPILCYHDVSPQEVPAFANYILPPAAFERQVRWLHRQGFQALTLDQLHAYLTGRAELPPKPIVITFDDAYRDLKDYATPLLHELGMPHVHFVNTGKIAGTTDWVERSPDLAILSEDDIREMVARYGETCDFQAHGKDHLAFSKLSPDEVQREVEHCRDELTRLTGKSVDYLAYPYGEYQAETPDVMRRLPIRGSFTVDPGACAPDQDLHLLRRVEVFTRDYWIDFVWKARWGWSPLYRPKVVLKRWYSKAMRLLGVLRGRRRAAHVA